MTTLARDIDHWAGELRREGWCIIPDALPVPMIAALDADLADTFDRTPFCEGGFYGETTKRFGRLLSRSDQTAALVQHETILGVVTGILSPWCDTIQLNVTQAIAVHPGAPAQLPHRDQKQGSHASAPPSRRKCRLPDCNGYATVHSAVFAALEPCRSGNCSRPRLPAALSPSTRVRYAPICRRCPCVSRSSEADILTGRCRGMGGENQDAPRTGSGVLGGRRVPGNE